MDEPGTRKASGRGRRPGVPATRDRILREALGLFAAKGYAATSLRAVARAAEVDPSLVVHFFGGKDSLFAAALGLLEPFQSRLAALREGNPADLPRLLAETYLGAWEDPDVSTSLSMIVRASTESPAAAELVRRSLESRALQTLVDDRTAAIRAQAALGQLFGLAVSRYLIGVQPLASLPFAELVDLAEPGVRACLEAPVDSPSSAGAQAEP